MIKRVYWLFFLVVLSVCVWGQNDQEIGTPSAENFGTDTSQQLLKDITIDQFEDAGFWYGSCFKGGKRLPSVPWRDTEREGGTYDEGQCDQEKRSGREGRDDVRTYASDSHGRVSIGIWPGACLVGSYSSDRVEFACLVVAENSKVDLEYRSISGGRGLAGHHRYIAGTKALFAANCHVRRTGSLGSGPFSRAYCTKTSFPRHSRNRKTPSWFVGTGNRRRGNGSWPCVGHPNSNQFRCGAGLKRDSDHQHGTNLSTVDEPR